MTTNTERAEENMSEWYEVKRYAPEIAQQLANAKPPILMPDLPGPDNDPSPHYLDGVIVARFGDVEACVSIEEYDNQKVTPDGEEVYIEVTHRAGNRAVYKTYGKYRDSPSLEDARKEALDLLAALDWIERNS